MHEIIMRPVSRRNHAVIERFRLPPVMVSGLMMLSSCGGETLSGKVVDGERSKNYSFEVKKGDVLWKRKRTGFLNRDLGQDITSIQDVRPGGVVLHIYGNHGTLPIKARTKVEGSITIPFRMCEGLIPSDYLIRFDQKGGKTYLTMIERVDIFDLKNSKSFSTVPDPCKP